MHCDDDYFDYDYDYDHDSWWWLCDEMICISDHLWNWKSAALFVTTRTKLRLSLPLPSIDTKTTSCQVTIRILIAAISHIQCDVGGPSRLERVERSWSQRLSWKPRPGHLHQGFESANLGTSCASHDEYHNISHHHHILYKGLVQL